MFQYCDYDSALLLEATIVICLCFSIVTRIIWVSARVSDPDPDPDPQDPHVFGLPGSGSGSGQKGKEMNE